MQPQRDALLGEISTFEIYRFSLCNPKHKQARDESRACLLEEVLGFVQTVEDFARDIHGVC